jgi:leucyl/phenylalanyl-tRNA--protein transferase
VPIAPDPTPWAFPHHSTWDPDDDLVALGADLEAGTLVTAYSLGLFPMPVTLDREEIGWFSPVERGVLPLYGLKVSRSLRRSVRDFEIRVNTAFEEVVLQCGNPDRPDGWITPAFVRAYTKLHRLGWAHSVETWRHGRLVGGLYGVSIGGLFAGESMFHVERDASKVALVELVDLMRDQYADQRVLDVQWQTPHLASLGVVRVSRGEYLEALESAIGLPPPEALRVDA